MPSIASKSWDKDLFQLALRLTAEGEPRQPDRVHFRDYESLWANLRRSARRLDVAQKHAWNHAAIVAAAQLRHCAEAVTTNLAHLIPHVHVSTSPAPVPSTNDLYRELAALRHEFVDFQYDAAKHELVVTTDAIELDGVSFGPFKIRLNWLKRTGDGPYRVEALEPNRAASNEEVTHPHVQDERLCEGDGQAAIRSGPALRLLCTRLPDSAHILAGPGLCRTR